MASSIRAQNQVRPSPITVDQAVSEALENNLTLLAERYNIPIAETRLITARQRPNPILTVGGDHVDLLGTGYDEFNAAGPSEYAVRTDFILERGSKRRRRIEVAESGREAARFGVLNTSRGIILEVQSAFVDVLLAKDNLSLAQENLKSLNDVVSVNDARVRAGDLAEVELLRSRVAALQFENAVRQGETRLRTASNRLQLLLGRTRQTAAFDVVGPMRREPHLVDADPAKELAQLREMAQERRPDLQGLQRQQIRTMYDLQLQLAQGKVDYVVGTEYRRQQGVNGKGNSLGFFFSTQLPVFNRNQGEIERVRQEQRQIEARIRELRAGILLEMENAYEQYLTSRKLMETFEQRMLQQARDVRRITEYSYRRGEATLVEFLDAQRAFNETMQGYNEARAEYARSLYTVENASGK